MKEEAIGDVLKAIEAFALELRQALLEKNSKLLKQSFRNLRRQNWRLYRKAQREKISSIVSGTREIAAAISKIKHNLNDAKSADRYIGIVINVVQNCNNYSREQETIFLGKLKQNLAIPTKKTKLNQDIIHQLTIILNDFLVMLETAQQKSLKSDKLLTYFEDRLQKGIAICGKQRHYYLLKANYKLINHFDIIITGFETLMTWQFDLASHYDLIKKQVKKMLNELEKLEDYNFTLYHGFGAYALPYIQSHGLKAPEDVPIVPDKYSELRAKYVFFTVHQRDALYYSGDANRCYYFYNGIEEANNEKVRKTGKGKPVKNVYTTYFQVPNRDKQVDVDTFMDLADANDDKWEQLSLKEMMKINKKAEAQFRHFVALKNPNKFIIIPYRVEDPEAGEHIIKGGVPPEELEFYQKKYIPRKIKRDSAPASFDEALRRLA